MNSNDLDMDLHQEIPPNPPDLIPNPISPIPSLTYKESLLSNNLVVNNLDDLVINDLNEDNYISNSYNQQSELTDSRLASHIDQIKKQIKKN